MARLIKGQEGKAEGKRLKVCRTELGRRRRSGADPEKAEQGEGSSRSPRGVLRDGGLQQPGTLERDPDKATRFRTEELKLTSTTFALTGDSAHNQAMVHWSGHNSSVSRMGLRAKE